MQFDPNRRELVALLGGVAAAWPFATHAQERVRRIGVLLAAYTQTDMAGQVRIATFLKGLAGLGWTEGRNIRLEYRWGEGNVARVQALAAELVQSAPDLILVVGDPALAELHRLKTSIPIVFTHVSEPVDSGFVASLARPGGNITGFQNFEPEMGGKWLGVLKEAVPNLRRVGALSSGDMIHHGPLLRAAQAVAPSLGLALVIVNVQHGGEIEGAIAKFAGPTDSALLVLPHPNTIAYRASINAVAARHRLPAIYPYRYFATDGGLMSYGPDQIDQWRGAAIYVDRIFRSEKPADLPVQAPTKFELVLNLRTAKALGLEFPATVLARADEVIE